MSLDKSTRMPDVSPRSQCAARVKQATNEGLHWETFVSEKLKEDTIWLVDMLSARRFDKSVTAAQAVADDLLSMIAIPLSTIGRISQSIVGILIPSVALKSSPDVYWKSPGNFTDSMDL